MKKYKLIKSFPGSPEVGSILHYLSEENNNYDGNGAMYYDMWSNRWEVGHVESNPEYFASELHVTEDGVSLFELDSYWFIFPNNTIGEGIARSTNVWAKHCFSTREAAEAYLESIKQTDFNTVEINYKR